LTLKEQLEQIYRREGALTPAIVVKEASDPEHPLHPRFNWDDETAAHSYRLNQAAELIRSVKVKFREGTEKEGPRFVRAFHSLPNEEARVYEPLDEILADPLKLRMLTQQMKRDWVAMKRRYSDFEAFWELVRKDTSEAA
jgi:hypothetical protein